MNNKGIKNLIITCLVCLSPIILGLILWDKLPREVAIHFNINNEPDNFASKGFAVFGIPIIMVLMQVIICGLTGINSKKYGEVKEFETVAKWIIPGVTVVLEVATLGYAVGWEIDMRKVACLIVGVIFIAMGKFLPKLSYIKNYKIEPQKARKINRFTGALMVIMGILMVLTIFLPPIASVIVLFLLIPCVIISVIYGIKVIREK